MGQLARAATCYLLSLTEIEVYLYYLFGEPLTTFFAVRVNAESDDVVV